MEIDTEPLGRRGRRGLRPASSEEDLALLRAHEPVLRYTSGELFFPTAVGPYVEALQPLGAARTQGGEQNELVAPAAS